MSDESIKKLVVIVIGIFMACVTPFLPINDATEPLDKLTAGQLVGMILAALGLLYTTHRGR